MRFMKSKPSSCFPVRRTPVAGVTDLPAFEARLVEVAAAMERVLARLDEDADWNDALYTPLNVDVEVLESGKVARRTELDFAAACRTYLPKQGLLLLGDPGGGKSTSLRHLARQGLREVAATGVLPVHANLRQWAGAERPASEGGVELLAFVRGALRRSLAAEDADFLDAHLDGLVAAGRVAFLLDSFDEIPVLLDRDDASEALAQLSAQLEGLATLPGAPMLLVASRYFRRPRLKSREFLIVELKPFPDARLHAVAAARGNLPDALLDTFLGRGGPWLKHARNPFMAMLLFDHLARSGGQEPRDLAALYEGFVHARLATKLGEEGAARVVRNTQSIAEAMLVGSDGGLEGSIRAVSERLSDTPDLDVAATVDALVGVRIMRRGVEDPDNFTFVHRRFNEYFLALRWQANGTVPDLSAIVGDRKERDALVIHAEIASEEERRRILGWCLGFVADAMEPGHWERVARGEAGRRDRLTGASFRLTEEDGDRWVVRSVDERAVVFGREGEAEEKRAVAERSVDVRVEVQVGDVISPDTVLISWRSESCEWWSTDPAEAGTLPAVPLGVAEDALPPDPLVRVTRALRFLDDAFGRQPERIPERALAVLVRYVSQAIHGVTDLLRMKFALEVAGLLPAKTVGELLKAVLALNNSWLTDVALRSARFVRELDENAQQALHVWLSRLDDQDLASLAPELLRVSAAGMLLAFLREEVEARIAWERRARWMRLLFLLVVPWTMLVWSLVHAWKKWAPTDHQPTFRLDFRTSFLFTFLLLGCSGYLNGWSIAVRPTLDAATYALGIDDYNNIVSDALSPPTNENISWRSRRDYTSEQAQAEVSGNLGWLRGDREAVVGRTLYAQQMVEQWLASREGNPLNTVTIQALTDEEAETWWREHPDVSWSKEEGTYYVRAFRTHADAEKFLSEEVDPFSAVVRTGREMNLDEERSASNTMDTVARSLHVGHVSSPFSVPVPKATEGTHAFLVIALKSHEMPAYRTLTTMSPERRASHKEYILEQRLLQEATRVVESHAPSETTPRIHRALGEGTVQLAIAKANGDGRPLSVRLPNDLFARAYARAWEDADIVEQARPLLAKHLAYLQTREGLAEDENRSHAEELRERTTLAIAGILGLLCCIVGGYGVASSDRHDSRGGTFWFLILGGSAWTVWEVWHRDVERYWRAIEWPWNAPSATPVATDELDAFIEEFSVRTSPILPRTELGTWFDLHVQWMDSHFGRSSNPVVVGSILVVLGIIAAGIIWFVATQWWRTHLRSVAFNRKHWFRATMAWVVTVFVGIILISVSVLMPATGWLVRHRELAMVGDASTTEGWGAFSICLGIAANFAAIWVVERAAWAARLREKINDVFTDSFGSMLAAWVISTCTLALIIYVSAWPLHAPLTAAGLIGFALMIAGVIMDKLLSWFASIIQPPTEEVAASLLLSGSIADEFSPAWNDRPSLWAVLIQAELGAARRATLLDAIAAHHLAAGTVPEGDWPDGRVPYFKDDPVSSTRLAQLDEKWRGLDR